MSKKIRIKEPVKHNGVVLNVDEVYEFQDDAEADSLINTKAAVEMPNEYDPSLEEPEVQPPVTPKFDAKKKGYMAEATPTRELKEDEVDETPVVGNTEADTTPDPKEKTVVLDENGNPLPEDKVKEAEQQAAAQAPTVNTPTTEELAKTGEEVK